MAEALGVDPGIGISGDTTTLQGSVTGPIGMLTNIAQEGSQATKIDVSTMNSGRYLINIPGKIDPRQWTLQLVYENKNFAKIQGLVGGQNQNWTITLPDGSTLVQAGHFAELGTAIPFNDKITQSARLDMSGAPIFNSSSGNA